MPLARRCARSKGCCKIARKLLCFAQVVACLVVGGLQSDTSKRRQKREGAVSAACRTAFRMRCAQMTPARCHANSDGLCTSGDMSVECCPGGSSKEAPKSVRVL